MSRLIASMRVRKGSGRLRSSKRSTPSRMRASASRTSALAEAAAAGAAKAGALAASPCAAPAAASGRGAGAATLAATGFFPAADLPLGAGAGGGSRPSTLRPPSLSRTRSISGCARRSRVKCQRPISGWTSANSSSASATVATGAPSRSCSTSLFTCTGPRRASTGAPPGG